MGAGHKIRARDYGGQTVNDVRYTQAEIEEKLAPKRAKVEVGREPTDQDRERQERAEEKRLLRAAKRQRVHDHVPRADMERVFVEMKAAGIEINGKEIGRVQSISYDVPNVESVELSPWRSDIESDPLLDKIAGEVLDYIEGDKEES